MSDTIIFKRICRNKSGRIIVILLFILIHSQSFSQNPPPPIIDSISVVQTSGDEYKTVIGWKSYDWTGFNIDSSGFIVREVIPNQGYANPDTIFNALDTFYIDYSSSPRDHIYGYGLVAFTIKDGILLKSQIADLYSRNIQLKVNLYDSCSMAINLNWNTYYGEEASSLQADPPYQILISSASDSRVEQTNNTQYKVSNLEKNEDYQIKIFIESSDWSSTSAPISFWSNSPPLQQAPIFQKIATDKNYQTFVTAEFDLPNASIAKLYAAQASFSTFELIDSVHVNSSILKFIHSLQVREVYKYIVRSWDLCGNEKESKPVNSMILKGVQLGSRVRLFVNEVLGYQGKYKLVRTVNNRDKVFELDSSLEFNDDEVFNMNLDSPNVIYRVIFNYKDSLEVESNPYLISLSEDLRWPNSIIAGQPGVDGAFRPFVERVKPSEYNLKIYSKWGSLIFESNNIETAWRAKYKGKYVMPGAYLYTCTYREEGKAPRTVRGTVTVLN